MRFIRGVLPPVSYKHGVWRAGWVSIVWEYLMLSTRRCKSETGRKPVNFGLIHDFALIISCVFAASLFISRGVFIFVFASHKAHPFSSLLQPNNGGKNKIAVALRGAISYVTSESSFFYSNSKIPNLWLYTNTPSLMTPFPHWRRPIDPSNKFSLFSFRTFHQHIHIQCFTNPLGEDCRPSYADKSG